MMAEKSGAKFKKEREKLNKIVMKYSTLETKRFFSLDGQMYRDGAIPVKYKEMMGLVGSVALRCDDCIKYHLTRCHEESISDTELIECLNVALIIGGSITIPHLRRALKFWDEITKSINN